MRYSLKIAEFYMKPGSQEEMYYTDDKGDLFIGSVKNVLVGKTYQVEVTPKRLGGTYHRIISWLD
jgi:hypothetical protein